ncbi:MAG: glutamate--tRNA ligase [Phenylobacterium sp.]|uniref:glutamate--tRNA ligase n=2 Tax=Phenylobacterium sp. TaxID=1871053 RepID=UPI00260132C9|nr:glutamate--tRNA ligase [Phenylobacterium sp.]MCA6224783.1 glutamate--tRNA ligase [Phenylobacterium sp.]MCA6227756.1 glutamate--tRNA ligase [Phenylobacterium sp.]MCA6232364.1 glutamate--tRNA ligase [Phenylobacterium sp.]MCA6233560.1 glutamate--tRNA ligase [Phenylobacterium sp.]MCA6249182.1 glutamate--tRNA ligase [Phenylobacterium sp.]
MSERQVVTRIAPSPTGSMHIGTARTALFNWLYARRMGGKYLLRIEDTDRERSTDAAVKVILDGLSWLGLEPDEPPVFQFSRADRHRAVALELLARGGAYRDYMTPDELAEERERARAEGRVVRSPWRDANGGPEDPERPHVIRLRAPQSGETRIDDQVKGEVIFRNADLDDLILLRTDGTPTYNLAVVVDDHDMGVTHVIRGDDHLTNAARQTHIYQAMGWETPVWAHLPMIHGPDGKKLSKRHGAQAVSEFDDMGYLPEALRNYLAKLGWGHGDDEIFTDDQARAWFDIRDVVGAPARLDWDKLNHLNNHYIRLADPERLAGLVEKVLRSRDWPLHDGDREILLRTLPLVREGARTVLDLADAVIFALKRRPLELPEKARGQLTEETCARLGRLAVQLEEAEWTLAALEATIRGFAEAEGVGIGKFGPALRAVLSGGSPAPDLAGALISVGRDESLARIHDALPNEALGGIRL